ncbi:hypothetical protein [Streptomyces sp. TS71-3]|uniref:hypothetical protein n=1 Tax=Streptomyces sp. TS71-3 TaxID=2733862 RepID=UPI001B1F70DA|nr:hypothetical protein [Streptomyces sp. TS71-3]GHJ37100.1 hypothetical protein Sm713_27090 [Streptomyces sp. TS71-3]
MAVGGDFHQQTHHYYYPPAAPGPAPTGLPGAGTGEGAVRSGTGGGAGPRGADAMPLDVGDTLAGRVHEQWNEAALQRKLLQEIPIRWTRTLRPVAGETVVPADPGRPRLVRAVPGATAPGDPAAHEGGIPELFSVYSRVASGRVVVLGAPGSGKSDAALLTVLRALEHRNALRDGTARAQCPVPVLLSIVGWDGQGLTDWLAACLDDDYRLGRRQAEELIEAGWISLFLDSFDEMADDLRAAALREIDRAAYRAVIFSRPDEFEAAVADGHLVGAVALELSPVPADAAIDFLRTLPPLAPLQRLIGHLRNEPDSTVSQALTTPLTLTLVRDAFPRRHIADLDDMLARRFASRHDVERYLLGRLVTIRYQQPASSTSTASTAYEPAQAVRWLGYVAGRMNRQESYEEDGSRVDVRTYSLDWRRLHYWASPWPRIAMTALLGVLVAVPGCALDFGLGHDSLLWVEGVRGGALVGGVLGFLFGIAAGTIAELRDPVPRWRKRLNIGRGPRRRRLHPAAGALVALPAVFNSAPHSAASWAIAIVNGVTTGSLTSFAAARLSAAPGWTGWSRWRGLGSWPVLAAAGLGALGTGLTQQDRWGPVVAACMAVYTVSIVVAARPASLVDPVTDPYTSWRQDRRYAVVSGVIFGACVALAVGLDNLRRGAEAGVGWGTLPFVVLGAGLPLTFAGMLTVSDSSRTIMLFIQLRLRREFPLSGMRFLKDAYDHRVFRAEGSRYQFRHALLQDELARDRDGAELP